MIKIFYVEDEPFLAKIVKETLEKNSFEVFHHDSGSTASEQFEPDTYDCCILDIMLPGMNGYDLAKSIRQKSPNIPILFLTAKDQTEDLVKGFRSGGNDYIKKPFSIEELIIRVENLLSLTQYSIESSSSGSAIRIGENFEFHPNKQLLSFKNEDERLSYKESQLLSILCDNLNQPTERKEILMAIWQDDSFYNSRNLDVYITKLRGYLKKDSSIELITLKGVGYRLSVGS